MLAAQTKAETLRIVRSPFFLLFSIAMPMVFYFLFSAINGVQTEIASTTWGAYLLMSMTAFSLVGTSVGQFGIRLAYERRDGWMALLRLTPLPPGVWLGGKLGAHMAIHLLIIALLFPTAGLVYGIDLTAGQWIACGLWLWIGSLPFLAIGSLMGSLKNADAATAIANILHMGLAILGGLWMPLQAMPDWIQKIGVWTPTHRYAHGAWNILAGKAPDMIDIGILSACFLLFMVLSGYLMNRREAI
ncbi:ABC transporter permease [Paenibacillus sp. GYB004]|uniref:ABC transporter permease n=1 Tax=Paenibacillus sp. GYB004 TaxID=2994393 RepID=UPI002F965F64